MVSEQATRHSTVWLAHADLAFRTLSYVRIADQLDTIGQRYAVREDTFLAAKINVGRDTTK